MDLSIDPVIYVQSMYTRVLAGLNDHSIDLVIYVQSVCINAFLPASIERARLHGSDAAYSGY